MKANRKTMLGVALAVAVIALAGIGYATLGGYTAKVTSDDNAGATKYITIKLAEDTTDDAKCISGTSVYTGQTVVVEYNTVTTDDTHISYEMKDATVTMNFKIAVEGTTNTANDKYTITFTTLPNVTVKGGEAKWYWSGDASEITTGSAFTEKKISDLNGTTLSLKITKGEAVTEAPNGTITIGTIVIDVLNTTSA